MVVKSQPEGEAGQIALDMNRARRVYRQASLVLILEVCTCIHVD